MTILHATSNPQFMKHLRNVIDDATHVDIAVGYFYLSGFKEVADLLDRRAGSVRILIGRTDRPTLQEIEAGYHPSENSSQFSANQSRLEDQRIRDETLGNVGKNAAAQAQDATSEAGIKSLAQLIADGKVEVRAYLKERMHAKVYIGYTGLSSNPGTAIIGSTNFSASGFMGNTELNYPITHAGDVVETGKWFNRLWDDSESVSDQVVEQLKASWPLATPDPYLVYLKVLYEFYGDTLGQEILPQSQPQVELTDYQQDAVAAGLAILEKHGGCYIADVVGLGKTYIGAEILRRLDLNHPETGDPLIICPAGLRPMWERIADQFGIEADVISRDQLRENAVNTDRNFRKILRRAGPVLIDEAHSFRNNNQRRRVLTDFLGNGKKHKVILLSATPQNLAPVDILRQLELFLNSRNHGLPGIKGPLNAYFPSDADESTTEQTAEVLRHLLIRRRRQDIVRDYPDSAINGKPITFPTPELSNRQYSLDHAYHKAGGLQNIVALLKSHQAARYNSGKYLKDESKAKPEYQRMINLGAGPAALIRTLSFKRLESSIPAFRSTIGNLIESNRTFRNSILNGEVSQDDGLTDIDENYDEQDVAEISVERINIKDQTYDANDFNYASWLDDLDKDYEKLNALQEAVADLTPEDDAKLYEIKSFVKIPGVNAEKLLIFTESKVTANYLYQQLSADHPTETVEILTGGDPRSAEKVRRFSPRSNDTPDMAEKEQIRILIATDVIAEGQNLQDCGRVMNYDLHWNPVTLIQRYGRIDRVTTEHTKIYLHNMLPDIGVDKEIGLTRRLSSRVQSFHNLIGLDDAILQQTEKVNPHSIYAIYDGEMPEQEDDPLDSLTTALQANALLNRVRREQPELWNKLLNMPDGLRVATGENEGPHTGKTLVLNSNGDVKQGYTVNSDLSATEIGQAEFIKAFACEPETQPTSLPPDIGKRIMAAKDAFESKLRPQPEISGPRQRNNRNNAHIQRELGQLRLEQAGNAEALQIIESLRQTFLGELTPSVNTRITQLRNSGTTGSALVTALTDIQYRTVSTETWEEDPQSQTPKSTDIRIVCSMTR